MINEYHINCFRGILKEIFKNELFSGNIIQKTWENWSYENVVAVCLSKIFITSINESTKDIIFSNINDNHYWKAQYYDKVNNLLLVCR